MRLELLDALLAVLMLGALVTVVAAIILKRSCPETSAAYPALFAKGTLPPYSSIVSLNGRFILPWIPPPDLAGCGPWARRSLVIARFGLGISIFALLLMVALGLSGHLV
jgi:hypothetical protein